MPGRRRTECDGYPKAFSRRLPNGYTLIEMLMVITFLEPVMMGVGEGGRAGILGAAIGFLVGLLIASLWIGIFYSWVNRKLRTQPSGLASGIFLLIVLFMMGALPTMALVFTHRLTTPFIANTK